MSKRYMAILAVVLSAGVAGSVSAQDNGSGRSIEEIYTQCGIGGALFGNMEGSAKYLAIVSNVTWDVGTTAILSDASSPESCSGGEATTAALLIHSYPKIENELAMGGGEHLDALINNMGCSADSADITAAMRSDMSEAMNSPDFSTLDRIGKSGVVFDSLRENCTV